MFFTFLVFLSAFLLEGIGTYVSVIGLGTLFAYSMVVMIMAVALDIAKVVTVTFLYRHWKEIGVTMKSYMLAATFVLMVITSTGVFGYLSGEFQKAISGNSQQTVLIQSLEEEQGRLQKRKEEIDKQVSQLSQNNVRGRRQLMQQFGPEVNRLNDRLAEIDKKLPELKITSIEKEIHVGPIMYVAKVFDTTPEKAVTWVIATIIGVFDPLAIALLIAGNFLLARRKKPAYEPDDGPLTDKQLAEIRSTTPQNREATSSLFPTDPPEVVSFDAGPAAPTITELVDKEDNRKRLTTDELKNDPVIAAAVEKSLTPWVPPNLDEPPIHLPGPFSMDESIEDTPPKPKRKYTRKPKATPPPAPTREKVVIKPPPRKPRAVTVEQKEDKEIIKLEPAPTKLEQVDARQGDVVRNDGKSQHLTRYNQS